MRYFAFLLILTSVIFLHSFELKGDIRSWKIDDFINSDKMGNNFEND